VALVVVVHEEVRPEEVHREAGGVVLEGWHGNGWHAISICVIHILILIALLGSNVFITSVESTNIQYVTPASKTEIKPELVITVLQTFYGHSSAACCCLHSSKDTEHFIPISMILW